jgi:hypothetical protein
MTMTTKTENPEDVQKLRDYLVSERPADFDMNTWCRCVAGYALRVLSDETPAEVYIAPRARELLGISIATSVDLFWSGTLDSDGPVDLDIAIARLDAILAGEEMAQ